VKHTWRVGAIATIAFAVLGIVWFWLEMAPVRLGFEDTDDPAVGLRFLRDHSETYVQGDIFMLSTWAICLSLIGWWTRTIPIALCVLAVLPAFRIASGILGPLGFVPDGLWFLSILSIPGTLAWCLALGIVFLRRAVAEPAASPAR
jgi:hypothetical protein